MDTSPIESITFLGKDRSEVSYCYVPFPQIAHFFGRELSIYGLT